MSAALRVFESETNYRQRSPRTSVAFCVPRRKSATTSQKPTRWPRTCLFSTIRSVDRKRTRPRRAIGTVDPSVRTTSSGAARPTEPRDVRARGTCPPQNYVPRLGTGLALPEPCGLAVDVRAAVTCGSWVGVGTGAPAASASRRTASPTRNGQEVKPGGREVTARFRFNSFSLPRAVEEAVPTQGGASRRRRAGPEVVGELSAAATAPMTRLVAQYRKRTDEAAARSTTRTTAAASAARPIPDEALREIAAHRHRRDCPRSRLPAPAPRTVPRHEARDASQLAYAPAASASIPRRAAPFSANRIYTNATKGRKKHG